MEETKLAAFKLIGLNLGKKTTNEDGQSGIDCGNLWQQFEKENFVQRIPNKVSDDVYAVYFDYEGDHTQPFSYFIGCMVNMDTEVPPGMDSLLIPADNYSKVLAKGIMPDCISNFWKDIWNTKTDRAYNYDFEVYDERSKDWNNAEVEIYVSSSH
jgi:predicted transcriptional regulator YdeE